MSGVDHVAKALAQAEIAENANGLFNMQRAARLAEIHATLAVAEQARLANLIAVLNGDDDLRPQGWMTNTNEAVVERIKERNRLRAGIRDGLGL